jgi:hypothetical protein
MFLNLSPLGEAGDAPPSSQLFTYIVSKKTKTLSGWWF